jgi:hypothetical protein
MSYNMAAIVFVINVNAEWTTHYLGILLLQTFDMLHTDYTNK